MEQTRADLQQDCASCGATLQGKFCHACGEKKLNPDKDLSVRHFLTETFEHFTHLDSKLMRSFWLLFTRPGFLTAEFIAGRRVRYLKPIPLFVIAGVLFYLFFGRATAFFSNLGDMTRGYENHNWVSNTFHVDTGALLSKKAAAAKLEPEACWQQMVPSASQLSKTWLVLIVPVWGLLLWLFLYRKISWLVPHLVYALNGLSFFVLFDLLMLFLSSKILGFHQLGDNYTSLLAVCFGIYNVLAVRRVYGLGWLGSVIAGFGAMFLFLVVLILFRQSMTIWTLMYS